MFYVQNYENNLFVRAESNGQHDQLPLTPNLREAKAFTTFVAANQFSQKFDHHYWVTDAQLANAI